ncbi:hypothetical protein, partial [Klebsiella pneumoniae]|uniref:hypothetical protein n=1 Tax=Klebsiella pneumoniae TaxID=573 RepID=UPI00117B78D2
MAALNSMVFRLVNFPLSRKNYSKELKTIMQIAEYNGYKKDVVSKLVKKRKKKLLIRNTTSFKIDLENKPTNVKIPNYPKYTRGLAKTLKDVNYR